MYHFDINVEPVAIFKRKLGALGKQASWHNDRMTEMIENRKILQARRWCENMTKAHFHITLDSTTQKAVILWTNGRVWRDVPEKYQAGTVELLRSGETFTACSMQPGLSRIQVQRQRQQPEHSNTATLPFSQSHARNYLSAIASIGND